jgi:hypothetical protein
VLSKRNLLLVAVIQLIFSVTLAQNSQPQKLPEPKTIYTCGEHYQPVDLLFVDNTLYSTDAQLLRKEGGQNIYDLETLRPEEQHSRRGFVYKHDDECKAIGEFDRPFGIAILYEDSLCVTHQEPLEGVFGLPYEPALSCFYKGVWQEMFRGYNDLNLGANDLVKFDSGVLVATLDDIGIPSIVGVLRYLEDVPLAQSGASEFFQFLDVTSDDEILATSVYQESNLIKSGSIIKFTIDKQSLKQRNMLGEIATISSNLPFPTGIKALGNSVLVVDYKLGELHYLSQDGQTFHVFTGLQGPMGITQGPDGDICIAEMRGGRISCYSLASLGLE